MSRVTETKLVTTIPLFLW